MTNSAKVVLASWVSAQRLNIDQGVLTTDMEPYPINPYGVSKLVGELIAHAPRGLAVTCRLLRRGITGPARTWAGVVGSGNAAVRSRSLPGNGAFGNGWGITFAVLNLMSDNPGMRWDIENTKRTIGSAPQDGAAPVLTQPIDRTNEVRTICAEWPNGWMQYPHAALVAAATYAGEKEASRPGR